MPARVSETYVLRTYPFRESDLIVSFFTRDQGKLRGVAYRARKEEPLAVRRTNPAQRIQLQETSAPSRQSRLR